ncbi:tRNA (adenosine(37)-N6)-dimethylallyltransferase MiaA [Oricola sp.]|uniref:tRNA (adenosine(37)-N6)-dimethylallyltransferase MiaA n=1 Tax=Oricola sp. TaxID=1979950 RepID=UPI003BAB9A1F
MRSATQNIALIAGPTASGKSALALEMAERTGGVVVNADSMQVYDVLQVLTARPDPEELARASHRLYGHVDPAQPYSTGRWLTDAAAVANDPELAGRPLIFVGGTGLYFRALLEGLSPMPAIPDQARAHWRMRLAEEGAQALHRELQRDDPVAAGSIGSTDGQRIVRALEVLDASGESITALQARKGTPLVADAACEKVLIMPERAALYGNIETRLDKMIELGAIDEVARLRAMKLDPAMPAMKAIGVREFSMYLDGQLTLEAAVDRAKTATRQYAKRQMTWFCNQFDNSWSIT